MMFEQIFKSVIKMALKLESEKPEIEKTKTLPCGVIIKVRKTQTSFSGIRSDLSDFLFYHETNEEKGYYNFEVTKGILSKSIVESWQADLLTKSFIQLVQSF